LFKNDDAKALVDKAWDLAKLLKAEGLRVTVDDRDNHNPGFKFNSWEIKGTPVRLELGAKDFAANEVKCCIRHDGKKFQVKHENLAKEMVEMMDTIHNDMFAKAKAARDSHVKNIDNWGDFMEAMNQKNLCLAPWCDQVKCEKKIKDQSKEESLAKMIEANDDEVTLTGSAKTLCIPFELGNQNLAEGTKCFFCGEQAKVTALWGRSY
jgi:prolyl-tRNA synthetase